MTNEITREEMIKWVSDNQTCSNVDMPEWLLEISIDLDEVEDYRCFYRDLFGMAHFRAIANNQDHLTIDMDDFKRRLVLYLNNLNFVIDLESMRRSGDFFKMYIYDIFSLDCETPIIIYRNGENNTADLKEILDEFLIDKDCDDDYDY